MKIVKVLLEGGLFIIFLISLLIMSALTYRVYGIAESIALIIIHCAIQTIISELEIFQKVKSTIIGRYIRQTPTIKLYRYYEMVAIFSGVIAFGVPLAIAFIYHHVIVAIMIWMLFTGLMIVFRQFADDVPSEKRYTSHRAEFIGDSYYCDKCDLTSFTEIPTVIRGTLMCHDNNIESFHNIHKHFKHIGGAIYCDKVDNMLGLALIPGITTVIVNDNKELSEIFTAHINDCIALQDALIDAGFVKEARL